MIHSILFPFFLLLLLSYPAEGFELWGDSDDRFYHTFIPSGYYGCDNRTELHLYQDKMIRNLARSTAGMVPLDYLTKQADGLYGIPRVIRLEQATNLCPDERFVTQLDLVACTGFLISEDLLVTAGHCIEDRSDCESYGWIFDYTEERSSEFQIHQEQIFFCKDVIDRVFGDSEEMDYSVIKLDRKVTGRTPLRVRRQGKINDNEKVLIIGHPFGTSTKIADNAFVIDNSFEHHFFADLDAFVGNSGSPVINARTGEVEGILSAGSPDVIFDNQRNCYATYRCSSGKNCEGELVTRITSVRQLR